jgi:hypothetical protein
MTLRRGISLVKASIVRSRVYQRAYDRGEFDLERIPSAVLAMPFDLVRHDLLIPPLRW